MIIPVRCFSCGTVLADKYRYYQEMVGFEKEKTSQSDGVVYFTKEQNTKSIEGKVMDSMGLFKMCCRRHILTHVDIF